MAEEVYVSFETGGDDFNILGDTAGIDFWQGQRFTTAANITCTSASIYIADVAKTPFGDITFRIETSVDNKPSGTLIHANATGIVAFADIVIDGWNKADFTPFALPAGTYWLVVKLPDQARGEFYFMYCDFDGVGWSAETQDHGETWDSYENSYINYFRIYREIVVAESKFRDNICHKGYPLGFQVRRQINKEWIYRIKCGTQEKYPYFVPTNPKTAPQQAWRVKFTAGIAAAKLLSEAEKEVYRKKAKRKPGQTWHSLFMSWYLWKESHT